MKPCSTIVVLCALIFSSASFGEEKSGPILTALSSTTISGYVNTSTHWRRHVCRPVRPVRVQHVYKLSNGVFREAGYAVRCRHGFVYLPNGIITSEFSTPNRSSRFFFHTATPRIDNQTVLILVEARRIQPRRPPTLPPLPPLPPPPYRGTNYPPVPPIIWPGGGINATSLPPRFRVPTTSTNQGSELPNRIITGIYSGSVTLRVRPLDWTNSLRAVVLENRLPQ